jgi:hypothetical protein
LLPAAALGRDVVPAIPADDRPAFEIFVAEELADAVLVERTDVRKRDQSA